MTPKPPSAAVEEHLRDPKRQGGTALVAYLTAGFPDLEAFPGILRSTASVADVVEIGIPFTDPMADGPTIQRTNRTALSQGVTLEGLFRLLEGMEVGVPLLLMSYLNPLLAFGIDELVDRSARSGVSGFIVPDLPLEECALIKDPADSRGLALVQLVSPVTPAGRMVELCRASRGFVYAVTTTGITGGEQDTAGLADYLGQVRAASSIPICAGFGIRHGDQVRQLAPYVDGVIVGSALLEAIEQGTDPAGFLEGLVAGSGS